ncbi:MAG: uracil-DNA glycosylase [Planctomycetaceae bacterium]|nr:uracil-DNA glycosylase [Planctomycetaceae bacterium]
MSNEAHDPGVTTRAMVQSLRTWRQAGLTHLTHPSPLEIVPSAADVSLPTESAVVAPVSTESAIIPESQSAGTPSGALLPASLVPDLESDTMPRRSRADANETALARPEREQRLAALARKVAKCTRCHELATTRTQTVFGVGNPEARVMFVGEAPGADEDAQGEPFVGRAGQLLNRIIAACGWQREDIYICNILRCRPPGNRNPSEEEAANCREFLDGQIAIVNPEYIVCWGSVAAKNLLGRDEPIGRMREKWFEHGRAKVLCTYHPSYLLRNPAAKKPVWEDMQRLLADMGLEPPQG